MKYLKLFEAKQTDSMVAKICKRFNIQNWSINSDGLVDVDGNVELFDYQLTKLPLKFGKVTGSFYCQRNLLTTLAGSPTHVVGNFDCDKNHLKSLKGAPQYVGGNFDCQNNKLTTLEGSPEKIGGSFWCNTNPVLRSLKGGPKEVGDSFSCIDCGLWSLEYSPLKLGKMFCCSNNIIESLEGVPKQIFDDFICSGNNWLKTLKGGPEYVRGNFNCSFNKSLTSLKGSPREIGGKFNCQHSAITSLRFGPESVDGQVYAWGNQITDIPKKYLTDDYLEFIIKEQYDWNLYRKDGSLYLERLEQMIEWGKENNKIKPV